MEYSTGVVTRPDWDKFCHATSGAYLSCNCGQILQTQEAVREHWQAGHFDYVKSEYSSLSDGEVA